MNPRPDELAADAEINRYQKLNKGIKAAAAGGLALAAGSKIMPFLNEMIPTDLAFKGISKISPKISNFLKRGMTQGLTLKGGLDFVKENFMKQTDTKEESAPDQRSIIEKYSPELHQFMKQHIQQGRSPLEAGALAEMGGKFKSVISKIVKDHKSPWSSIIETVFGKGDIAKKPMTREEALARFREIRMNPRNKELNNQEQQIGSGQQALMEILKKIQSSRGQ